MIQLRSILQVADNSGAKKVQCLRVLNGYQRRYAGVGDLITVVVKQATPHAAVKKSDILPAIVVRTKKEISRSDGTYLRFNENACVIIDKKTGEPKGSRIFGPIPREVRKAGYIKIASLAPEVL